MPDMTWVFLTILSCAGVSITIYMATWLFFRHWCQPDRIASSLSPADYKLAWETIQFYSQGVQLHGWFIPATELKTPAPTIAIMHGWSHNAGRMLELAKWINQAKFAVLLFDGRGHGCSGGDGPSYVLKFSQDIIAAVEYLQSRSDVDTRRIGVIGHSIGGAGAILSAATDKRIRAVVSSSSFSDPNDLTRNTLKRTHVPIWPFLPIIQSIFRLWIGMPIASVSPRCRIGLIEVPTLLAHGASDRFVDPVNLDVLYDHANPKVVKRLLLSGCRHSDMLNDHLYIEKVIAFLSSALKPETTIKST